jgi:hypothetical protein
MTLIENIVIKALLDISGMNLYAVFPDLSLTLILFHLRKQCV